MSEMNGWKERMDRFERGLEHLLQGQAKHEEWLNRHEAALDKLLLSQQQLLTAQVVLTDRVDKIATSVQSLSEAQERTQGVVAEMGERMNSLIRVVDDLVRRQNRN